MERAYVVDQLSRGANHLETDSYKTAKTYGTLGKYMAPGTQHALRIYTALPHKYTDLLLDPARPGSDKAAVSKYLDTYHAKYINTSAERYEPLTVTLMRKLIHTKVADRGERVTFVTLHMTSRRVPCGYSKVTRVLTGLHHIRE